MRGGGSVLEGGGVGGRGSALSPLLLVGLATRLLGREAAPEELGPRTGVQALPPRE